MKREENDHSEVWIEGKESGRRKILENRNIPKVFGRREIIQKVDTIKKFGFRHKSILSQKNTNR